jgi:hypothetical protein
MNKLAYILAIMLFLSLALPGIKSFSHPAQTVTAIAWSNDGQQIAVGYDSGRIDIIDTASGTIVSTLRGHTNRILKLEWHSQNVMLASSGFDATVHTWNTQTGTEMHRFDDTFAQAMVWDSNGDNLIAALRLNGLLRSWNISTGELISDRQGGTISDLAWNSDFSIIAHGGIGGVIAFTDNTLGQNGYLPAIYQPEAKEGNFSWDVAQLEWNSDDKQIAAGFLNGVVRIWSYPDLDLIAEVDSSTDAVFNPLTTTIADLKFLENGTQLLTVTYGGVLRNWDLATANVLIETQLPVASIASAFSPAGTQVAYINESGHLEILDITSTSTQQPHTTIMLPPTAPPTPIPSPIATVTPTPFQPLSACWVANHDDTNMTEWHISNPNPVPLAADPEVSVRYNWRVYPEYDGQGDLFQEVVAWDRNEPNPVMTVLSKSIVLEWYLVTTGQPSEILGSTTVNANASGYCP